MARRRPVLLATDFSPASLPATRLAVEVAGRERAPLIVLHVLTPPSPFLGETSPPASYLELLVLARSAARRRLDRVAALARGQGARARGVMVEGVPATEILRQARRHGARVIVLGTHGRSGLGRAFMGSVAERVLARAACPVLTVRGRRRPR
jgi:nucleotide-binding universal stress UspA family protein